MQSIRNFSIIAHIDHGKSTLADRMLEITGTIEKRKMSNQVLDSMELEKERGITIKMTPVRMNYKNHVLNLIDTPGHIDFSYEVSRALKAVEGSLLLVDATQGVQAQTLTTLSMARESGLVIVPVVTKIDAPTAEKEKVRDEIVTLLGCNSEDILYVSGKTGEGVENLLDEIITRVPPPHSISEKTNDSRSLIFDFEYSNHQGIIVYVRVFDGVIQKGDQIIFASSERKFTVLETGLFKPGRIPANAIHSGEIGYVVTGIKEPGVSSVGDTLLGGSCSLDALSGYEQPKPVVFASLYPESQDDFPSLKLALGRLKLSDASFTYEEESSGALGRGFRCGFLGMLHLEIITERLKREFNLALVVTTPSITYHVRLRNKKDIIVYAPHLFPDDGTIESVSEPWVLCTIIVPNIYLGTLMVLCYEHEAEVGITETFGDSRVKLHLTMPLRELMRNFFDEIKSVTSGYASLSYELGVMRPAEVTRLDILVADEVVPAFTRVISKRRAHDEAEKAVERLFHILPRQLFVTKIQGFALGRILASRTISALRKDVTGYLYGGDITRKMKLLEKQKKGKKKMKERGKVNIPHDVFLKMMKNDGN